ncbi:MAG TPA: DUF6600 domain-containing protein [Rhodanobacteraceae bacterium]|nr:DUF6600 domain-containing protein [Rhodanobacteraceae bacterium]
MSRIRLVPIKLLPAALAAALVMLGSTTIASAQYYDQGPSYDQSAPQDQNTQTDPSDRVARLAYLTGDVEFAPAGENDWGSADINRPMTTGDRLMTGNDGRAALELGDAALRINDDSAFNFLDLDDTTTQVELSQGTLNLRVRRLGDGQVYEVDTPTVAFVASEPGTYRVDVAPNGNGAMVTVFEGSGTVYGENGASRPVQAGQSYRFDDSTLANVAEQGVPAPDDFDRFCESRDQRYTNSVSRRYVSDDVVGYDDLDDYGNWQSTPDYGDVWYPTRVATGWAPYRDGHWAWIEPWGWTWVDNEPWGYAPFHYGRWVYVSDRWGWVPGPRTVRPVYAPALVAFVGGSGFSLSISVGGGGPVGWFPLGPRDVYVPPYRASRNYFTSINVTNIRNVYVNKTVINNYYGSYAAGRPYAGAREYAYRDNPHAFTVVPRNVFAGAKPVRAAVLHVNASALARATVAPIPHVAPTRASLAISPPKQPIARPVAKAFDRTVVARHAPPPRPVPFAAREKVIAKQGGAPIPVTQLRQMRQQQAKAQPQPERVKVVAAAPNRPGQRTTTPNPQHPVQAPRSGERPPAHASIHPIQAPVNPSNGNARSAQGEQALRPGELPSARFAHGPRNGSNAPERAAENQQRAEQARQQAEQANRNGEHAQAQAEQNRAQAAQDQRNAGQSRQQADQARAQQQADQARAQQQAEQARQRNEQAQQHADQERQRADQQRAQQQQQQAEQARQRDQQAQQRAQEERQRADQERAQQQQAQRAEQQRAQQEQRAQQQERQRADQEQRQREQQAQMQQEREAQMQQERQAQMQQQREAQMQQERQAQMRAQQQEQRARQQQQRPQHEPAPARSKEQKKKDDQQDNGH